MIWTHPEWPCARNVPSPYPVSESFDTPASAAHAHSCHMRLSITRESQRRKMGSPDGYRRAKIPYFRICDLRSTYATRLNAGGMTDQWVTQLLRQCDSQVFKRYSQMKLQMKREVLEKLNRLANEMAPEAGIAMIQ